MISVKEKWLLPDAVVPVNVETTRALVEGIKDLLADIGLLRVRLARDPWVGLTYEEFEQCYEALDEPIDDWTLGRAIEAKLKEKNG